MTVDPIPLSKFWNCSGNYVGYRAADGLFHRDGHQIGYFAEGNEIYGCNGRYLGEVRGKDRLISNLSKRDWARSVRLPSAVEHPSENRKLSPVVVHPGYEDFPADL